MLSLWENELVVMQYSRYAGPFTLMIVIFLLNAGQVSLQSCQFLLKLTNSIRQLNTSADRITSVFFSPWAFVSSVNLFFLVSISSI